MDAIIATKVNSALKTCASSYAMSATECSTPQLRDLFAKASQDAIRRQHELYTLMEQRGWYRALPAHREDIQAVLPQLQQFVNTPVGVR